MPEVPCPCGSGSAYEHCCEPLISRQRTAATPEELMRSRFTAFTQGNEDYLLYSWHVETRPASIDLDDIEWLRLFINETQGNTVTFTATFTENGRRGRMTEKSQFATVDDQDQPRWVYVSGTHF